MITLTKNQAEYVQVANERLGFPGKITRKEMQLLVDEGLTKKLAFWMRDIPELKVDRATYKLPHNDEVQIRKNLPRGRKKKIVENTCVVE